MRKIEAAAALVDMLECEGVSHVFGVPGGPILALCDALARSAKIEFVLTRHEQGAAYAAFAYAHATGRLGVCAATLGPGATNLLAGLPVALVEGAPVLAITGQVQDDGIARGGHQESSGWFNTPDQRAMFAATCKATDICHEERHLPHKLRQLIRIAHADRPGPVHIQFPSGVLHGKIEYPRLAPRAYRVVEDRRIDLAAARRAADRIGAARRPVLLVGSRCRADECAAPLLALAKKAGIGIACDLGAKSAVDERADLFLGCIGALGHRAAERAVKDHCDLLIAVGTSFDEISTLGWDPAFVEGRELIQLDCLAEEIGKAFPVGDAALGHLPTLIAAIDDAMAAPEQGVLDERLAGLAALRRTSPLYADREMSSDRCPPLPQRIIADLRAALPDDALVLSDSSKWARWLGRFFEAAPGQVLSAHDYEPMGWAVAGAVGAKAALPDRPVVCLSGDGAFMMSMVELASAREQEFPIIWIVAEDRRLGIIYDLQTTLFGNRIVGTELGVNTDLVRIGEVFGIESVRIEQPGGLIGAVRDALTRKVAKLIVVNFDADEIPTLRPRSLVVTRGMGLPVPTPGPETTRALIKLLKDR